MAHRMNLFAPEDDQDRQDSVQTSESNALDEMFAASRRFRSSAGYLEMLHFIVRFQYYSAFDGLLLFLQNPSVTYVATTGAGRKRLNRYPKADHHQMPPVGLIAILAASSYIEDMGKSRWKKHKKQGRHGSL